MSSNKEQAAARPNAAKPADRPTEERPGAAAAAKPSPKPANAQPGKWANRQQRQPGNSLTPAVRAAQPAPATAGGQAIARGTGPTPLYPTPQTWSIEALRIDIAAEARKKRSQFIKRMLMFVVLPTLLVAAYVFLYATPRYVSEFQVTYQSYGSSGGGGSAGPLAALMGGGSSGGGGGVVDMTRVLQSYFESDTLLKAVDQQLHLREHYSNPKIDWLDRLRANASDEDFLDYFSHRVTVDDMVGGYLVVDVETFDRDYTIAVAKAMMKAADDMVDNMTQRARSEEVRVAQDELTKSQDRLVKVTQDMTAFENDHRDFNPTTIATQLDSVVGGLESQLSIARAELTRDRSFMAANSPQISSLNSRIQALEQQIQDEKVRLASTESVGSDSAADAGGKNTTHGVPYSQIVADYTALQLEQKFASDSYLAAKQAYDMAKADSMRKENFIEGFVTPNHPQKSTSPDPWVYIPTAFLVSLVGYMVLSLLIASFREQSGV
jgi:capsular polysaccharide transport system permease protein